MPERLSPEQIQARLRALKGWELKENRIEKLFKCGDFRGAIRFVGQVADLAEAADHHPDIHIRFHRVTLILTTHSAKGLTENDFNLAEQVDAIAPEGSRG